MKSRKLVQSLFKTGRSFVQYPLRLVWLPLEGRGGAYPVQFAVSVPKRRFRRAVQRNRIRRLIREAYRLHKYQLYEALEGEGGQLAIMVIYIGEEEPVFPQVEAAVRVMIRRLIKACRKSRAIRKQD